MGFLKIRLSSRPIIVSAAIFLLVGYLTAYPASGAGLAAVGASPNSITLNWTAPGDDGNTGTASQYDIRYSTSNITESNWDAVTQVTGEPTPQPAGNTESIEVFGLNPSTTYYFAIKTADEVPNWSVLSNVISKSTDPENTPPATVADLSTGSISPNSMTLSWTAPGDDGTSGNAYEYDIRYSTSTITDANWDAAVQLTGEPTPQPAGNAESFLVSGLQPSTTYYFAIKTADEVPNWSNLSNIANGTTDAEPTPPNPPVLASPVNGAGDQVQPIAFDWADISGVDVYQLQLDSTAAFASTSLDTGVSFSSCSVSGLENGQTYFWRVRAHNNVGWGDWCSAWSFTTLCPTPAIPTLVSPNDGANNLNLPVMFDWSDVSDVVYYQVQVDDNASFGSPEVNMSTGTSYYSASNLDDQQTYYWRVRAYNDCGWSNWSSVWDFNTRDTTTPQAIAALGAAPNGGDDEILLSWTATGDDGNNGTAFQYDIRYDTLPITELNWGDAVQVSGEASPQVAGSSESMAITGLITGTEYYFAIKVSDEAGNWSGLSNVVNATPVDNIPPATIDDLSLETGTDDGVIHLSWTAPGDDNYSGIVSAYLIKYSQELITENNWDSATVYGEFIPPLPAGQNQTAIVSGLNAEELYYIAIKSSDDALNFSELSNVDSCKAGKSFVLDVDEGLVASVGPEPGAELHSSQPNLTVANIGPSSENMYYFEVAADSFFISSVAISPPVPQQGGDVTSWKVDERLNTGQTYFWRARANTAEYSVISSFTVKPITHAYPNPFCFTQAMEVTFTEIPEGSSLYIMSVSGAIVHHWTNINGGNLTWDGTNESGQQVASGTYLWFVENSDVKGKLIVIR